eukprot:scaffold1166_cov261-Pinguiococcus_pyrenoidosus.AAC.62
MIVGGRSGWTVLAARVYEHLLSRSAETGLHPFPLRAVSGDLSWQLRHAMSPGIELSAPSRSGPSAVGTSCATSPESRCAPSRYGMLLWERRLLDVDGVVREENLGAHAPWPAFLGSAAARGK